MTDTPSDAPEQTTERDVLLEAVGFAAERFLTAPHWEDAIPVVLARLGTAAGVSRAYIYENLVLDDGELAMDQRWEWCAPGVEGTMGRETAHRWPYSRGFERLRDELMARRPIFGLTRQFPVSEQMDMRKEGILSIAMVPIFCGPRWWGFMGFDHCFGQHPWTQAEIDALVAAAGTLGATIYRVEMEEQLAGTAQQLFEAETKYRALVEQIPAILYIDSAASGAISIYVSPQIEEILGVTPEEYLADPDLWRRMTHPDDLEEWDEEYEQFLETGLPEATDYRMIRPDGKVVWIHDRAAVLRDDKGVPFLTQGVMFDVTAQKEAEAEIEHLAYHDRLTGLPNRTMFEEHLGYALARARRSAGAVAVLYMDLDNFKTLNDTRGHGAGDELLKVIAERLQEAMRKTDLVARQGGDEFLVLVADVEMSRGDDPETGVYSVAESVAHRVMAAFASPFPVDGQEYATSASIGISVYPLDAHDPATLLMNADKAMYHSKRVNPGSFTVYGRDIEHD